VGGGWGGGGGGGRFSLSSQLSDRFFSFCFFLLESCSRDWDDSDVFGGFFRDYLSAFAGLRCLFSHLRVSVFSSPDVLRAGTLPNFFFCHLYRQHLPAFDVACAAKAFFCLVLLCRGGAAYSRGVARYLYL